MVAVLIVGGIYSLCKPSLNNLKGKFEEIEKGNNSVIRFTLGTKVYLFKWDYDRGLVQT